MPADEACATLDKAHAGNETIHRASGSYETGRAEAQRLTDHEVMAASIQAQNDAGFESELAKRGGRAKDNRSERDKQKSEDFLNIARRCRSDEEDEDDTDKLKAMGFGGGAQLEQSAYAAGAASASRLLGKSPSGSASYPALTSFRPAKHALRARKAGPCY